MLNIKKKDKQELEKKQYGIFKHTAVQICNWNKKAIRKQGVCYKQKFYNVDCHKCMQFTPLSLWCTNACIFCWRPMEYMSNNEIKELQVLKPEEFIEQLIEKRKKLLIGFAGREGQDKELLEDAFVPNHFAISLSGEPTLYPYLPELVKLLKEKYKARSVFIVSNAQKPSMIEKLITKKALPHQFYISMTAPNKQLFQKINCPKTKDYWKKYLKSLKLMSKMDCRTVIRLTIIKGLNDNDDLMQEFKEIIKIANPKMIEVKAYMFIGLSRKRLNKENMPRHNEIQDYALKFAKLINYDYIDEQPESRIVLLKRKDFNDLKFK